MEPITRWGSRVRLTPYKTNESAPDAADQGIWIDADAVRLLEPAWPKGPVVLGRSQEALTQVHTGQAPPVTVVGHVDDIARLLWDDGR